jgi:hypothetical protein
MTQLTDRPALLFRPGVIFALILAAAFLLRLFLVFSHDGYLGVDGGAYLLSVNTVLGDEHTKTGFTRPPLAPGWLLAPFVVTLGPDIGYKLWSAVFGLLPVIPVYLLTRKYVGPWWAVFAAGFAALDLTWVEMMVTGSLPLIAFTLLGMAFYSMSELSERFSWRHAVILTLSIGLIPWVNQTTAGLALIMLPVFWLGLWGASIRGIAHHGWGPGVFELPLNTALPVLLGGILAICALPWYLETLPGAPDLAYEGPKLYLTSWSDISWVQSLVLALPLGLFLVWKGPNPALKALGMGLIAIAFLMPWRSYDEVLINPPYRARYLMALLFYPGIAWVVATRWWSYFGHKASAAACAAFVGLMLVGSVHIFHAQAGYSLMVSAESGRALEYARTHSPGVGIASNHFSLSHWVSGLNKVESPFIFFTKPPPYYRQSNEDLRCLLNWIEGCDVLGARERLNVGYILVDERMPESLTYLPDFGYYGEHPERWQQTARAEWLKLEYEEGATKLWRIQPDYLTRQP